MPGDVAPDFTLNTKDGKQQITMSELGGRPTALVFASYTWGPFRRDVGDIENWYQDKKDEANFFFVYIREAHPTDGNLGAANVIEGVLIEQPKTDAERAEVAELCTTSLQVSMPTIIDKIDDRVANVYAAFPDRIYVVGSDGRIAYKGQPGPSGFNVPEAMAALEIAMDGEITPYGEQPGARRARRGGRGARGARGGMPGGRGEGMGVMDADADGRISAEEWAGESDVFERFDADGDGFLTLGEVQRGGRGGE
jgi:hypothetical protein